ncbi:histidine phosphatase superfamily [Massariosphaeria phaeospora]|uniref:Histidine phosphatase superfamily n=1 Tax=Massariosphaeria phaeospora TaxID=100035 RepID=A0A7C8I166_9PLEO|nr:histidine phosphatase superfamily [Massariosphaeria phaeospora]
MQLAVAFAVLAALAPIDAAETVLGAYIFHRHGDRSPKSLPPTNLTTLGYEQSYTSGQYYRSRYLRGSSKIRGINEDQVKLSQLSITAPVDNVLQNSATGFLQGLYPPVGQSVQTLANGRGVQAPMDGYQLIPVNTISTGAGSEDVGWLQDVSSCTNAKLSSNSYFTSEEYRHLKSNTKAFYSSLVPVVKDTLDEADVNYKNAYIIFDLINVATIHNSSIPSSDVLTNETLTQARTLANAHEFGLAYNNSDVARAMSGKQLAGEILEYMNSTITAGTAGSSANKLSIQFGAYATFLSFFGLVGLPKAHIDFTGVPDYASSMAFELFTDANVESGFPSTDDVQVRFLFHNGTASNSSQPSVYPLFGGSANTMSFTDFSAKLGEFAISTTEAWCRECGNTDGACAAYASTKDNNHAPLQQDRDSNGMSAAVGGVIGAFVTLAVVLSGLFVVMMLGGFRIVSKRALGAKPICDAENIEEKA